VARAELQARVQSATGPSSRDLRLTLILVAAAFCLAWAPRLTWGFWTDEAGTYWMAADGLREAVARCRAWVGQSILYGAIASFFVVPGRFQELILRLPSLAGITVATWFTYRIAERFVCRGSGPVALVTLVCLPDVVSLGTSARVYALAMACAAAATYFLFRWRESPAWRTAAAYGVTAALLVNLHYLAAFLLLPHGLYVVHIWIAARRGGATPGWKLPAAAAVAIPLGLLPILGHIRLTMEQASLFDGAMKPRVWDLVIFCFPPLALLGAGLGLGMAWLLRRRLVFQPAPLAPETAVLLVVWLCAAPLAFFLAATFTPRSIFAARYLMFVLPAVALLAAWLSSALVEAHARRILTLALFAAQVMHPSMLLASFGQAPASWREPLAAVRSFPSEIPVFVASGLIESGRMKWKEQNPATGHLFAALSAYPVRNPLYPLPFQFSPEAAGYIEARVESNEFRARSFALLCEYGSPLHQWFSSTMRRRGFRVKEQPVNSMGLIIATPQ
jgi:hypothetical protein